MQVVIQIKVIGNPQPTYTWTRNGFPIVSGNGVIVTHDSLTFNSVTRVHSGQYVYEAINTLGMSSLTFSLDVQCKFRAFMHKWEVYAYCMHKTVGA